MYQRSTEKPLPALTAQERAELIGKGTRAGVEARGAAGECGDGWGLESVSILLIVMQQTIM